MAGQARAGRRAEVQRYGEAMSFRRILLALLAVVAVIAVRNAIADKGGSYDPALDS
jgi:hypothetical protein